MKTRRHFFLSQTFSGKLILLSFFFAFFSCTSADDRNKVLLNKNLDTQQISSITVKKEHHKKFDPEELKKNSASVFIFLSPDCPLCQGYTPVIRNLDSVYNKDSVKFYAVFPGKLYSDNDIEKFFTEYKFQVSYFIDDNFMLTDFMKATTTPESFIVNRAGEVVYGGRIDNWAYELGKKRTVVTQHDLNDALQQFISGKEIKNKRTEAVGCIIEKVK